MAEAQLIKQLFIKCDKDRSGTISARELANVLRLLGNFNNREVVRMFQVVDKNNDGVVRYDEFVDWLLAFRQSPEEMRTSIRQGTVCVVKQACTVWALSTGWNRIGELRAGQQVTAAGPPHEVSGNLMVPLNASSMVEAKLLYIHHGNPAVPTQPHRPSAPTQPERPANTPSVPAQPERPANTPSVPTQPERPAPGSSVSATVSFTIADEFWRQHHTSDFAEASADAAAEGGTQSDGFDNPSIVLRRGESIRLSAKTPTAAASSHTVVFYDRWVGSAPPIVCLPTANQSDVKDGSCFTGSASGNLAELLVGLPHKMPAGEYTVQVLQGGDAGDLVVPEATQANRVLVLLNPWCTAAEEHLDDEVARQEYVMLESGLLFYGTVNQKGTMGWEYGQFEPGVLAATRRMLRGLTPQDRASPISISRAMSAFCNAQDENGVLVGNWSGNYEGGEGPMHWKGSVDILSEWYTNCRPVKFGQCWVFAGVLTSVMRCIGVPSRPVTNYLSAHDTHGNRMIDEIYDEDGTKLDESGDSIWNFHVWTEAWMARPDLEGGNGGSVAAGLGGWQAIDATPQELSGGVFRCGPASLAAIKLGLSVAYDTDFLIGEVNADVRRYMRSGGEVKLVETITNHVGQSILTKALGSWQGEDVVQRYKAPEGSALERGSLLRQAAGSTNLGSLALDINGGGAIMVGSTAAAKLKFVSPDSVNLPAEELAMSLRAYATEYTGRGRTLLGSADARLTISEAERTGMTLALDTGSAHFESMLRGSGFPMIVVGTARSNDGKILLVTEEATDLVVAEVELVSIIPRAAPFVKSNVTLSFTNPFTNRPLTQVKVLVEGKRLVGKTRRILSFPDLEPGETLKFDVEIRPNRGGGDLLLAVTLACAELEGVHGKHIIQPVTA